MNQYNLVISILYSNVNKNIQRRLKQNPNFKLIKNIPNSFKINNIEYMNNLEKKFPDYINCEYQKLVEIYNETINFIRKENELFEKRRAMKILAFTAIFCEISDAQFPNKSLDPFLLRCKMNCTCLSFSSYNEELCIAGGFILGALLGGIGGIFIGLLI